MPGCGCRCRRLKVRRCGVWWSGRIRWGYGCRRWGVGWLRNRCRRLGRGDVFVAMRGDATDGNRYVEVAVAQGAAAVVTDSREAYARVRREHVGVAASLVEGGRRALAAV